MVILGPEHSCKNGDFVTSNEKISIKNKVREKKVIEMFIKAQSTHL